MDKISHACHALACYIIGQVDKWEHLKTWIIIEQQKEKYSVELEETLTALNKLENKKGRKGSPKKTGAVEE